MISRWRPFIFVQDTKGRRLIVYWRRLGLYLAALALTGWLAAAGAVWATLRHRHDFGGLSYLNIVLPFRWDEHRRALGRHYISRGRQALEESRVQDAVFNLRTGLHRAPAETEARQLLAEIYLRSGLPAPARDLLLARIKQEWQNLPYLKAVCALLAQTNQDQEIVRLARELLPASPAPGQPAAEYLALQAAQACHRLGDQRAAKEFLRTWRLEQTTDGILLLAEIDRFEGYPQLAVVSLQEAVSRFPKKPELSLALLRLLLDQEQTEPARQLALQRYSANPSSPGARIDLLHFHVVDRDQERVERETASFVRDHAGDQRALILLAQFAVRTAQPSIALRVREAAVLAGHPAHPFHVMEAETLIRAADYPAALEAITRAAQDPAPRRDTLLNGFRAVIARSQHDSTALNYLGAFLAQRPPVGESLAIAQLFAGLSEPRLALRVLSEAVGRDPTRKELLIPLVKAAMELGDQSELETYLPRLQALPNPPRAVLDEASLRLTTLQTAAREATAAAEAAALAAATAAEAARIEAAAQADAEPVPESEPALSTQENPPPNP